MAKKAMSAPDVVNPVVSRILSRHTGKLQTLGTIDISVKKTPTELYTLDHALSGGIPMNKIIEIAGDSGAGKTSLALLICHAFQKKYPTRGVVYIDTESALDDVLAMEIYGLDPERTFIARPDQNITAEDLVAIMLDAAFDPAISCVVMDSVAGLVTEEEKGKEAGEISISPIAKLIGRNLKKLNGRQDPEGAAVVLLNQVRRTIGPIAQGGGKIVTPGGQAMEFYPSLRLRLKRIESLREGKDGPEIGFVTRCLTFKARHSLNRMSCDWSVMYGKEGISTLRSVVTMALQQKLIVQSGSWFQVMGGEKFLGMNRLLDALRENKEMLTLLQDNLSFTEKEEAA